MSDPSRRPIDRERPVVSRMWFVLGILATLSATLMIILWGVGEVPIEFVYGAVGSAVVWWGAGLVGMRKMLWVADPTHLVGPPSDD
jgi:hypothetical protein